MNQVVAAYPSITTSTYTGYPFVAPPMPRLRDVTPSAPVIPDLLEVDVL